MGSAHTKGRSFEQDIGKMLQQHDGECDRFAEMTTSTLRVGQQTNLSIDVLSKNLAVECKRRSDTPNWLQEAFDQIQERGEDVAKIPLLVVKADYKDPMYIINEDTLKLLLEKLNDNEEEF